MIVILSRNNIASISLATFRIYQILIITCIDDAVIALSIFVNTKKYSSYQ